MRHAKSDLPLLKHTLTASGSKVAVAGSRNLTVRLHRGHMMQALMIIIDNALVAIREASTIDPQIEIQIVEEKEFQGLSNRAVKPCSFSPRDRRAVPF